MFVDYVLPQFLAWRHAGQACAIVSLVRVEGSSPRPVGSQMAVNQTGAYVGHITAGCAEAAIAADAVRHIEEQRSGCVRYGQGSKYLDVQLPCGSGIDVHIDPLITTHDAESLDALVGQRKPASLDLSLTATDHQVRELDEGARTGLAAGAAEDNIFRRIYEPVVRLVVAGKGPTVVSLTRIASEMGWEIVVASPEQGTLSEVDAHCSTTQHLAQPTDFRTTSIDPWTGVVLLFHDHEWEPPILSKVLMSKAFYVGALGSRKTQALRTDILRQMGSEEAALSRVKGPIGLDIGSQTPPEIALSIVAEVIEATRKSWPPDL